MITFHDFLLGLGPRIWGYTHNIITIILQWLTVEIPISTWIVDIAPNQSITPVPTLDPVPVHIPGTALSASRSPCPSLRMSSKSCKLRCQDAMATKPRRRIIEAAACNVLGCQRCCDWSTAFMWFTSHIINTVFIIYIYTQYIYIYIYLYIYIYINSV